MAPPAIPSTPTSFETIGDQGGPRVGQEYAPVGASRTGSPAENTGPLKAGQKFGPRSASSGCWASAAWVRSMAWDAELGVPSRSRSSARGHDRPRPPKSRSASSASCCSRGRSRTRTSSAFTTSARSTASSTSRCRTSTAPTSRRCSSARAGCRSAGAAHRALGRRRTRRRAQGRRRPPRPEARQHHDRATTARR